MVLYIPNPDVDLVFLSPENEREKLQLTNIIKNLHVSFETSLEISKFKRLDPDPVKYFGSYRIQIHCTADLGFSLS
jgi:hypothetical protein